jgi:hypothetical protein
MGRVQSSFDHPTNLADSFFQRQFECCAFLQFCKAPHPFVLLTSEDRKRKWADDQDARDIFIYAKEKASGHTLLPCYAVSDAAAETIVDIAATIGASQLILGAPQRNMIVNLLRGNIIRNISSLLPDEIDLLVYA